MGCLFENDNKICTCAMNEERKEECSKAVKEQGYTGCVHIKTKDKTIDIESNENIAYIELEGLTINEARKICGLSEIDNPICNSILVRKEPVKYICKKIDLEAQKKARKITNKSIKDIKKREKEIKQLIKKHPNEDIVKDLLKVNKQCMKALENIDEQESRKMNNNEIKEVKEGEVNSMENMETKNKCTLSFEEDRKLQEEKIAGLVNLITDYAIENEMSVELVDISFEHVRRAYYKNALIKR